MTPKEDTSDSTSSPQLSTIDRELQDQAEKDASERRNLKIAFAGAAVFHAVLLLVTFPQLLAKPSPPPQRAETVFVVQPVRFKPPAAPRQQEVPKRKAKRIPIPDPTPDDPEPIVIEELIEVDLDLPEVDPAIFGIPDAPPTATAFGHGDVMQLGGGVVKPEKLSGDHPLYSEEARKGRIQGVVILQAIIDVMGNVASIDVLKPLPLGLSESAIETVKAWRYKPATLDGKPVSVYMNILVNFSLQ